MVRRRSARGGSIDCVCGQRNVTGEMTNPTTKPKHTHGGFDSRACGHGQGRVPLLFAGRWRELEQGATNRLPISVPPTHAQQLHPVHHGMGTPRLAALYCRHSQSLRPSPHVPFSPSRSFISRTAPPLNTGNPLHGNPPTHPSHPPPPPRPDSTPTPTPHLNVFPVQATTLRPYLNCIKATLQAAMCLRDFPSQVVERHNKPEVEVRSGRELILNPIKLCRTEIEMCLIEPSINSVRVSILIKQSDDIENILAKKFTRFLMQRAEQFIVMRRKAIDVRSRE